MPQIDIISEMKKIRADARKKIEDGAITETYTADRKQILELLNSSLATELVCVLRYKRHFYMAKGINYEPVANEFLEHANEEQEHADRIATRIVQLGGEPDFSPANLLGRSHTEYVEGSSLTEMIKEDLIAERIAIDIYREIVRYIGDKDSTTRRLIEDILEDEEEHADDLANLITRMPGSSDGKSNGDKK